MRHVFSTAFIASSLIVGVTAQGQQPPTQPPAAAQAAKVTISGCIQTPAPEAPSTGAAAPATGAATSLSKFDLASAKMVGGTTPVGTTGTPPAATRYRLEGDEKTISPHLNHQVEITGTVAPATAAGATGTAAPMLKVESVKMIAAKCP